MARIRKVEIRNFRSIRSLDWTPAAGINCLIGPGDSGKSTILDAIDLCLGARRNVAISDTDFYGLDVTQNISISLTLGQLPDSLKNIETYGPFLRAFNPATGTVEDEPLNGLETVLTLNLSVAADLEPVWSLVSEPAAQAGLSRSIAWKDRIDLAPARLGNYANSHLSWSRGSVLNRLTDERADLGAELARAAREARTTFGDQAGSQLAGTLESVTRIAAGLGVPVGASTKALLDAHSVSIGDGAISLHSEAGIPLRNLGTGSTRLLIAGLQRAAAQSASIVLVDELEYGLEPHRLARLLGSLGAKDDVPPLQVFMTTHSPVALRELSGKQLFVVRSTSVGHQVVAVGEDNDIQGTIRKYPEAFLATTVIVCEGASEVGFVRGLDLYRVGFGLPSLFASGVAFADAGGGHPDEALRRGCAFLKLGYRAMVLIDSDKPPTPAQVQAFNEADGKLVAWRPERAIEDELFWSLSGQGVSALLSRALELTDDGMVDENLKSKSKGTKTLEEVWNEGLCYGFSPDTRRLLGEASRSKNSGWFKSVSKMEGVARDIVGPALDTADPEFRAIIEDLFGWVHAGSRV